MACLKSMELLVPLLVLFFTIFCLVFATIYGGRRVSLRPPDKTLYLKCVQELGNSIDEFSNDCGSMKISREQCQLLRSECLRLVQRTQAHSILKESFCAIRRALKLMKDCCSENWLLKAVEFGNCHGHFLEILLDLHRLSIVESLIDFGGESLDAMPTECRSIDISRRKRKKIRKACKSDKAALRTMLDSGGYPYQTLDCLADELKANPPLTAPKDITFDFLRSPSIYKGNGIGVFRVTFYDKEFVIKMLIRELGAEDPEDVQMHREAIFMKKCRHPYAIALLGSWKRLSDGRRLPLLLMESMECDLKKVITRKKRWSWWAGTRGVPALEAIDLVLPVAKVMKYLHEMGVVHLDLKPQNILYTGVPGTQEDVSVKLPEDFSVKLADFGDARMVRNGITCKVGTPGYMHPDVWDKKGGVDPFQADVFSFGMVFGEVLTGLSPLEALGCENADDFYRKFQKRKQLPLPKETPKFVKSIIESCWKPKQRKPEERPRYFDDICWKLQNTEFLLRNGCTR